MAKLGMQLTPNPHPLGEIELEWLVLRSLIQAVQDQLHFPIARNSARPVPFNCSISQIEKVSSPIQLLTLTLKRVKLKPFQFQGKIRGTRMSSTDGGSVWAITWQDIVLKNGIIHLGQFNTGFEFEITAIVWVTLKMIGLKLGLFLIGIKFRIHLRLVECRKWQKSV